MSTVFEEYRYKEDLADKRVQINFLWGSVYVTQLYIF